MKIWISKNAEVSVREQIVTQIKLGVATRDLSPGEKLPSTRELARRFGIHPNTVSAAYRELASNSIVEFRKGSGVFIAAQPESGATEKNIDTMLANFISVASASGFTRLDIESAMERWRDGGNKTSVTIVESDPGLGLIIREEITQHLGGSAACISLDEFLSGAYDKASTLVALNDEKEKMQAGLDPRQTTVFIDANPPTHSLIGSERPDKSNLIAVVSGWEQFIAFARVYLLAVKIDPEVLMIRSTSESGWRSGLDAASLIICDSFSAKSFPGDPRLRTFRLITDQSLAALNHALI